MRLPVRAFSALLSIPLASVCLAQTEAPTVDDVLNHYIRALGGKAAIQKLMSRIGKGTITIAGAGLEGTVTSWLMSPNKLLVAIELPGVGKMRQGFDGSLGWSEDPRTGLRVITGPELDDLRRTAVLDRALHMKDVYPGLAVKEKTTLDSKEAWVLETTLDPWTYRMFFDVASGLMIRFEMEQPLDSGGKSTVVLVPDDYRPVAGVMVPYSVSESSASVSWVERFTEITPNLMIDPSIFDRPPQAATPDADH
ncbi:MAG TPA: hypothetical protein VMJ34_23425 [Bryobacteraceae bacterium]|nr:hypothetical protein [Bryobacteraceae bacterium]